MKVISLNTWSGVVAEPLFNFFEQNKDVDVFCLQEIYKNAEEKETSKHPDYEIVLDIYERIEEILMDTHIGYFRPSYSDYYGNAIFVRKEIPVSEEGHMFIYVNDEPKKRGGHSRNLQYISLPVNNVPTVVVNLHGLWNGLGKIDTDDRIEQSNKIREFVQSRKEQKVVIGDFNLHPDTESLAIVEEGMRNLIKEYGITSTRTSYYEKEGKFADYAFVSPEIKVLDFKVLPEEVSDHAALYLEIG